MNAEQQSKVWGQIVARAWSDPKFRQRLLADPAAVLKEHGITVPAGVQVNVLEDSHSVRYLTLPSRPKGELSEAQLEHVAAAGWEDILGVRSIAGYTPMDFSERR